jgi:LysM repeat protein
MIEQQSRQIETLARQVNKIAESLPERSAPPSALMSPAETPATPAPTADSGANSEGSKSAAAAAPAGTSHTVAKGETLTSIAKLHKVSVTELQRTNKIENDRTLQIGQTLLIPAKPAEPAKTP